jgi:hypothetical protein
VLTDLGPKITAGAARTRELLLTVDDALGGDELATVAFRGGPMAVTRVDADTAYARVAEVLLSPGRAEALDAQIRQSRTPRVPWWQDVEAAVARSGATTSDGAAARVVAERLLPSAVAYRRGLDRQRQVENKKRRSNARAWIVAHLIGNTRDGLTGRQRTFRAPRWIPTLLWVMIAIGALEPPYLAYAVPHNLPKNPAIMTHAGDFITRITPFIRWASDPLTPFLAQWWSTDPWKTLAAYPAAMIVCLALIRRNRSRWGSRSWLALPGVLAGLILSAGLLLHLLATQFMPVWISLATMGWAALIAPVLALVAARLVAGPAR